MIDGLILVRLGTKIQLKLMEAYKKKLRLNNATVLQ